MQLDGKPMKVEIVGTNIVTPPPMPASANGSFRNFNGVPRRYLAYFWILKFSFLLLICYFLNGMHVFFYPIVFG